MAFVTGDIHGDELGNDFSERMERLRLVATEPNIDLGNPRIDDASPYAPICVTVGDVKLKYGNASSPKLRKYMNSHRDIAFVIMRGNHDTRYCRDHVTQYRMPVHGWKRTERDRFGSSFLYDERHPNVLYVSDGGGMYDVCGEPTLFIPGAYSPDQEFRMVHGEPYCLIAISTNRKSTKRWRHGSMPYGTRYRIGATRGFSVISITTCPYRIHMLVVG